MHWADVLAEKLFKEKKKHVLATGITPSGPIHIGNMREILTTDAVYRCLVEKGGDAEFIYIADDFDPLRKVYPYLPKTYEQYVGKPISDIPCPCGKHKSYADHYLFVFLNSLKEIGVNPHVYRASEMYKNGEYTEAIQIALENTDKIRTTIETISKRKLPKNWLPFNILCEKCGRISAAKPILYEYPIIEYICDCGYEGEVDIRKGGVGKLPWRVDWPARWKMLGVTFEPCGKDLATVGGARDTGAKIVEEIYNYPHPALLVYEFILLKGKGAMHSSKGTALSSDEMLKMTPPEVLRFLLMKNQPERHITFDSGLGLLNLIDEYDKEERVYFGKEEEPKGMKDLKKTYELSQPYQIPKEIPYQLPYRHLVTLVQIGKNWDGVKKILLRTRQIPKDLKKEDEKHLKQRTEHVRYWLDNFAPDMVKFELKKKMPELKLKEMRESDILLLIFLSYALSEVEWEKTLRKIKWDPKAIHDAVHEITNKVVRKEDFKKEDVFKIIYQLLLDKDKGPRAGYFLSNLDRELVLKRFGELTKRKDKILEEMSKQEMKVENFINGEDRHEIDIYNKLKLKETKRFILNMINEYNHNSGIKKYVKNIEEDESILNSVSYRNFVHIGIRPQLDNDIFDPNSNVFPHVIGLTSNIALGEKNYFVNKVLSNKSIKIFNEKMKNITPHYLKKLIGAWNAAIMLPVDILYGNWLRDQTWFKQIRFIDRDAKFLGLYPIYTVPPKFVKEIKDKIIVYDRDHMIWRYIKFHNKIIDRTERLSISISEEVDKNHKRDVIVKTVNDLKFDPKFVKVINIG